MPKQAAGAIVMILMHAADRMRATLLMLQPRVDRPAARDVVSTVHRESQSPWARCEAKCLGIDMSGCMIGQGRTFPEGMSYLHFVVLINAEEYQASGPLLLLIRMWVLTRGGCAVDFRGILVHCVFWL